MRITRPVYITSSADVHHLATLARMVSPRWFRALTQEALGELLLAQGRRDEARDMLSAALAFYSDPLAWRRRAEIEERLART